MSDQNKQLNIVETAYILKKSEKIVSALYLLSNFLSDKEPLKWQLRESGIKLLSENLSVSAVSQILSLLQVAHIGGMISEMNFNILKFELEVLIQKIDQEEKDKIKGSILSEQFFNVPAPVSSLESGVFSKGHNIVSDRLSFKKTSNVVKNGEQKQAQKSNRQDSILTLLKQGNQLSIKDFTSAIKDCSEKTVQRELVILVSKGLVRKEGEKRWSRYSLK